MEIRICFIGDSFVNGTGDPKCLGWTGRICQTVCDRGYDLTYYNLGVRRDTSTDINSRWLREVSCRLPPEVDGRVVFSFGANDMTLEAGKTRIESSQSVENIYQILTKAKQFFPVLMINSPPVEDTEHNIRIGNLSDDFAQVCLQLDIPYLDVFTPLKNSDIWRQEVIQNDGAHPRSLGYSELAKLVENWSSWIFWFQK
ncbi:GDSL-type esterase/lipase family protein [Okeania sp. SIO2B3]|uniref:GDSL-type esterase/lipase family protein n=1 Tax=Okeania sp. SIO2B3 TaxID=2607784 RepID=UPI0013BFEC29|nr:GDSL-type esterase/lipase family protein [Okeania sp. SIO2B3]NET46270.1 lipase [Okeania sp. SIO2B3]